MQTIFEPITDKKIKEINKEGWYWAQGSEVMANYGDTDTFTFCMCRNNQEAKKVAKAINLIEHLEDN
jgi:hypothetical protein